MARIDEASYFRLYNLEGKYTDIEIQTVSADVFNELLDTNYIQKYTSDSRNGALAYKYVSNGIVIKLLKPSGIVKIEIYNGYDQLVVDSNGDDYVINYEYTSGNSGAHYENEFYYWGVLRFELTSNLTDSAEIIKHKAESGAHKNNVKKINFEIQDDSLVDKDLTKDLFKSKMSEVINSNFLNKFYQIFYMGDLTDGENESYIEDPLSDTDYETYDLQIPSDYPDIRENAPDNSIVLLVGTTSSYGSAGTYDNFKFTAAATGGYNVYIDDVIYGTYASLANCAIVWSTYNATSGQAVTTPSALTAHIIKIVPVTSGNTITAFNCVMTAASGIEEQGVLWAHFNLSNQINLSYGFGRYSYYGNRLLQAITAKNNVIKISGISDCFIYTDYLSYIPILDCNNNSVNFHMIFWNSLTIKNITIKNGNISSLQYAFYSCLNVYKISLINITYQNGFVGSGMLNSCKKLLKLPNIDFSKVGSLSDNAINNCYVMEGSIDLSENTILRGNINCSSNKKISGLILNSSLTNVGNIYLNNCGLAHEALVTLFNSMPTVTSRTCIITGCPGVSELTADEKAIATGKGWTLVL